MTTRTDRLWSSFELTDEDRERARLAYERTPAVLDTLVLAALGHCEQTLDRVDEVLRRVRCSAT